MAENNTKNSNKHNALIKTGIIGVVAGLLGGGVAYAGLSQINGQNAPQTTVAPTAKVEKSNSKNSSQMTNAFNTVKNSVVSVVNLKRQSSSSTSDPFGIFGSDSSSSSKKNSKSDLETYSEGSGVIYMKSNGKGYIVTNNHVVSGSDEIQVILSDGKKVTAKKVGTDAETDLAVLTIDGKYVTQTAQFGSSKNLEPGQQVIAVGSPLGSEYATSVTQGIISAKNRTVDVTNSSGQVTNQATVIQTDAAINPGNSGGPLINSKGEVIGINTAKKVGEDIEGIGFAIPINEVKTRLGSLSKPILKLGITARTVTPELAKENKLEEGVYVVGVQEFSPAEKAGLKIGDLIVEFGGKRVKTLEELNQVKSQYNDGDSVPVEIIRDGKKVNLNLTLVAN